MTTNSSYIEIRTPTLTFVTLGFFKRSLKCDLVTPQNVISTQNVIHFLMHCSFITVFIRIKALGVYRVFTIFSHTFSASLFPINKEHCSNFMSSITFFIGWVGGGGGRLFICLATKTGAYLRWALIRINLR